MLFSPGEISIPLVSRCCRFKDERKAAVSSIRSGKNRSAPSNAQTQSGLKPATLPDNAMFDSVLGKLVTDIDQRLISSLLLPFFSRRTRQADIPDLDRRSAPTILSRIAGSKQMSL
jgi:hypothetical protein